MMEENAGRYFIHDGVIKDSVQADSVDLNRDCMVYEVLRVINGVPLFLEDHFTRMHESFYAIGHIWSMQAGELEKQISMLAETNKTENFNVKFIVFAVNELQTTVGYISKSYYPSDEQVSSGVPVDLFKRERKNPNIKLVNREYKQAVSKMKSERGLFEVLLVNQEGNITEGGASNVFFVKNNKIYTTPGGAVLKGITRKYVIEACKNVNYEVLEEFTSVSELDEVEGIFLSGTSIKVLPVSAIGDKKYGSAQHPVIVAVRDAYDRLIQNYINEHAKVV